ncbi:nucleolar complex protein 14 [Zalaria obscura]|uniref:Nucleolar complex protein 14 n=1 Tax=Zalaria obscura TaxID=2024903 RepID=A0ACC3SMI3_9PEZI
MPPSQLKRLKASLREQGITGPQKSKKEKKQSRGQNADQRVQRHAALQSIRDSFNPFEIKAPQRPSKFATTSNRPNAGPAVGRPGVTKSMGEEARRKTLLPEMQRRNKTGGILDRRIGENDPTMTPEERALQRFAREKAKKRGNVFDLEADDEDEFGGMLTHAGRALDFENGDGPQIRDDFEDEELSDEESETEGRPLKRRRPSLDDEGLEESAMEDGDENEPARKKTKAEVMKEVMAKSKLHKYERQKAKEDDDDLRAQLDEGMADMLALLRGHKPAPKPKEPELGPNAGMNPERMAMLNGLSHESADKQYDSRLRQMAMDKRAAPTERTKTEEEKVAEEAQRLKEMEDKRLRRMRGEEESEDEAEEEKPQQPPAEDFAFEDEDLPDDAAAFGLPSAPADNKPLVLEDEDEFALDEDLVASGSDIESDVSGESDSDSDDENIGEAYEDEEDEFVRGILSKDDKSRPELGQKPKDKPSTEIGKGVAYTYECPRTHAELLKTIQDVPTEEVPTVVQRIRALYHPSLSAENKEKLGGFAVALVDHISYMATAKQSLQVMETLIRHVHSLSRTYPETIAAAFRLHLDAFHKRGSPSTGDLAILTAIGSVYPTSDHFHQVVTPAITAIARWLEMTNPTTPSDFATGAFLVKLAIRYQGLSKRYAPEAVRFTLKALQHRPALTQAQLQPHVANLLSMADLWSSKSAFTEILAPAAVEALKGLGQKKALQHLNIQLSQSRLRRRPLELHHHRPLPIKTSVPKFEESFNPDKHYDPDRERADASKLRAEYKRERKGALRELRKDANFMAREQLREKRERDAEYEKKYKRLVAEIQGEEGHEAKQYEREKRMRKSKR